MKEQQRKAEINKIRKVRTQENAQVEAQILELAKKKMSEDLRKAELKALVKRRATNNAEAKAKLMALGVKYATRIPPARPTPCDCPEFQEQADEMLEHMERVVNYQAHPKTTPPLDLAIENSGKVDETEISKVRSEVAEVQGAMNMMAKILASQNVPGVIDTQPYINKLAHIEAVACCQSRVPYNAVPHQYVQAAPQVLVTPTGQVDNSEIDKVRSEVIEVKDAVNSLAKAFDSYNMGKMMGAIESLSKGQGGQPIIVNSTPGGYAQPQPHLAPSVQAASEPKKSSGLAEVLADMSKKLDKLDEDMKD